MSRDGGRQGIHPCHINLTPLVDAYRGRGIHMWARGFMKLDQLFLDRGRWNGGQVLSPIIATVREWAIRPFTALPKNRTRPSLGWTCRDPKLDHERWEHRLRVDLACLRPRASVRRVLRHLANVFRRPKYGAAVSTSGDVSHPWEQHVQLNPAPQQTLLFPALRGSVMNRSCPTREPKESALISRASDYL